MQNIDFIEAFEESGIRALTKALEIASEYVAKSASVSNTPELREVMARKIFVTAQGGEMRPLVLADHAIAFARQFERMQRILGKAA